MADVYISDVISSTSFVSISTLFLSSQPPALAPPKSSEIPESPVFVEFSSGGTLAHQLDHYTRKRPIVLSYQLLSQVELQF